MTSIYASSSDAYWKEHQKKNDTRVKLRIVGIALFGFIAIAGSVLYVKHTRVLSPPSPNNNDMPVVTKNVQRRRLHETTEHHWKECESRVNSSHECTSICLPERNSIHRKTMHQACLHGCQQAHIASAALGCRGKTDLGSKGELNEESISEEVGVLAFSHCAKFKAVDPKPDVFATCRKYHRAGTKQGFRMGQEAMTRVLDEEWATLREEQ